MNVLIDTNIWSLSLRRKSPPKNAVTAEFIRLMDPDHLPHIPELVRFELLAGVTPLARQRALRRELDEFPILKTSTTDYDLAAEYYSICVGQMVVSNATDFVLCAISVRRKMAIFTADRDFLHYTKHLPIKLHRPELTFPKTL